MKTIGTNAFHSCSKLTSVTIQGSLETIGEYAFGNCSLLANLTIGEGVKEIGKGAFFGCGMTSVNIPNSVTKIGDLAFAKSKLKSVTLGTGVTSIGTAFKECSALDTIISYATRPPLVNESYTFPDNWNKSKGVVCVPEESLEAYKKVNGWKNLFIQAIPKKTSDEDKDKEDETEKAPDPTPDPDDGNTDDDGNQDGDKDKDNTGDDDGNQDEDKDADTDTDTDDGGKHYYDLSIRTENGSLVYFDYDRETGDLRVTGGNYEGEIVIPDSAYGMAVSGIEANAFSGCTGLTSVTIPSSMKWIGSEAFQGCEGLTTVTSYVRDPFAINSNVFESAVKANATLCVPRGTAEKYQATGGWKEFANMKEFGSETGIEGIEAENVTVQTYGGALHISGAKDGTRVVVYSMTGAMVGSGNVTGGTAAITTSLRRGDIAVVRIGETAVKVIMR